MPAQPSDDPTLSGDGLPCDVEAERDLIGAVLYDERIFASSKVKPSDFTIERYRWIWEAMGTITAANDHIDLRSVEDELARAGRLEEINAVHTVTYLMDPYAWLHAERNTSRLLEMTERRAIIARANKLARDAFDLGMPLPAAPAFPKSHWTREELAQAEFPEPDGPVPGLIPNGLTILGGRPKRGKSWLMLQAGCTLGLGGKFLNQDLKLGKVLYYALEDRPRRLKDRTARLGIPPYALIEFELALQPLHLGGMAALEQAARYGGFRMIILDTIRRALPGKDFNKDGALFDDVLSKLQVLGQQCNIAIVCVLHTRKSSGGYEPDPVDDMLGSTGLTASADCVLALYTEQGKKGATLKGRGRELDDIDLALQFDPLTCAWQSLGESGKARVTEAENEILDLLAEIGKGQSRTIAKTLGKDYSNIHKRICALLAAGRIRKELIEGSAYYFLPKAKEDTEVPTMPTIPTTPTIYHV